MSQKIVGRLRSRAKRALGIISRGLVYRNQESEFQYAKTKLRESMNRLPKRMAERKGLLLGFNLSGQKPPIFWCFNCWSEAALLAHHLGKDRPLFAMRSLYGFFDDHGSKMLHRRALAREYANSIHQCHPQGQIVLGGNCQAAPIAEAVAHEYIRTQAEYPRLISLEYEPFYAYPGNLLLLFGDKSEEFNPMLTDVGPTDGWKRLHSSVAWGEISGAHGEFFRKPAVSQLVQYIQIFEKSDCEKSAKLRKLSLFDTQPDRG